MHQAARLGERGVVLSPPGVLARAPAPATRRE